MMVLRGWTRGGLGRKLARSWDGVRRRRSAFRRRRPAVRVRLNLPGRRETPAGCGPGVPSRAEESSGGPSFGVAAADPGAGAQESRLWRLMTLFHTPISLILVSPVRPGCPVPDTGANVTDAGLIEDPQQGQLPESLFIPEEACEILRVSRAHLYRQTRERRWPHRLLGDGVGIRFSAEDLQEIIDISYRPPALALLREVMDHRRLTNRYDEALILLPPDLVVRVEEALS